MFSPRRIQFDLQQTELEQEENNTYHQGDHNTDNDNHVDDLVVLMLNIPDFRVSTDLFPKHDDLQEPKVHKIGRLIYLSTTNMGSPSRDINLISKVQEAKWSSCMIWVGRVGLCAVQRLKIYSQKGFH